MINCVHGTVQTIVHYKSNMLHLIELQAPNKYSLQVIKVCHKMLYINSVYLLKTCEKGLIETCI